MGYASSGALATEDLQAWQDKLVWRSHRQGYCIAEASWCQYLQEGEAFASMYERGGLMTTEDGAFTLLAGATAGGGTRVNWSASELCLHLPGCFVK